ncbi:MAG: MmgE/PrpD family protein [Methylococcaceae bacterium]|nr:MmgE/PrpD family protein [Methylococcaceae bacterium]
MLAIIALHGRAGLAAFDAHYQDPAVAAFRGKVRMLADAEVEAAYPARWIARVEVETVDGRTLLGRADQPKGDPGNTLSRAEIEDKALRLAAYRGGASAAEMRRVIALVWGMAENPRVPVFLP